MILLAVILISLNSYIKVQQVQETFKNSYFLSNIFNKKVYMYEEGNLSGTRFQNCIFFIWRKLICEIEIVCYMQNLTGVCLCCCLFVRIKIKKTETHLLFIRGRIIL